MKPTIDEFKRDILMGLIKDLENDLCSLLHNIENDETVTDDTWNSIDNISSGLFSLITKIKEELIYS